MPANTDPLANRISTASLVLGRPRNSILQPDGLLSSSTRLEAFASSYQSSGIHPDEMCTRFHITAANHSRRPGRQVPKPAPHPSPPTPHPSDHTPPSPLTPHLQTTPLISKMHAISTWSGPVNRHRDLLTWYYVELRMPLLRRPKL